jgi:hypothetical protein
VFSSDAERHGNDSEHGEAGSFLLILLRKLIRDVGAKRFVERALPFRPEAAVSGLGLNELLERFVGANPELFRNRFVAILEISPGVELHKHVVTASDPLLRT